MLAAVLSATPFVDAQNIDSPTITGGVASHVLVRGDTLTSLSARYGVPVQALALDNGRDAATRLAAGRTLRIDNRHIVPAVPHDAVLIVNIPQRMLFYRGEGWAGLPVAVGRPTWPTPIGDFHVALREQNPTWDVPASILAEARREGHELPPHVPPGPDNPLGAFWLGLDAGGVGIHGTNAPTSIYRFATHGCIRLHPDDIAWVVPARAGRRTGCPDLRAHVADSCW